MIYEEFAPSPALHSYVDRFWILEGEAVAPPEPILPDGRTEIIVHAGQPFVEVRGDSRLRQDDVLVAGQLTTAVTVAPTGTACVVGARLHAHAAFIFFGIPQSSLVDRIVPLADIDRRLARRLRDDVSSRSSRSARIAALERALIAALPQHRPHQPEAAAVTTAVRSGGLVRVSDMAHAAGVGPRQLERLFDERVGLSPKQLLRTIRFQQVLGTLRGFPGSPDWSRIAVDHGFYDQAHFVRDFKRFTGVTPAAWEVSDDSLTAIFSALQGRRAR